MTKKQMCGVIADLLDEAYCIYHSDKLGDEGKTRCWSVYLAYIRLSEFIGFDWRRDEDGNHRVFC